MYDRAHYRKGKFTSRISSFRSAVPKVCSADPLGSAASSQGIRGYISVMAALKFGILIKIIAELAMCLFRMTFRISN